MKIQKITATNIGPHTKTTINLSDLGDGIHVLHAPSATGKTTLIASAVAAIWGKFPLNGRELVSLKKLTPAVCNEKSSVSVTIELYNGETYTIERTWDPHEARIRTEAGAIVAGPKVTDVAAWVDRNIGDLDTALYTLWMSRESRHDLTSLTDSQRREAFGKFLGFEEFDRLSEQWKEKSKKHQSQAEILTKSVGDISTVELQISSCNDAIEKANTAIRDLQEGIAEVEKENSPVASLIEEKQRFFSETKASIEVLKSRSSTIIADMEKKKNSEAIVERQTKEIALLTEKINTLKRHLVNYEKNLQVSINIKGDIEHNASVDTQKKRILNRIKDAQANIEKITSYAIPQQPEGDLDSLLKELAKAEIEATEAIEFNKEIDSEIQSLNLQITDLTATGRAAAKDLERVKGELLALQNRKVPSTPADPETCSICPLFKEFALIPGMIEEKKRQVEEIEKQLDAWRSELRIIKESKIPDLQKSKRIVPDTQNLKSLIQSHRDYQAKKAVHDERLKQVEQWKKQIEKDNLEIQNLPEKKKIPNTETPEEFQVIIKVTQNKIEEMNNAKSKAEREIDEAKFIIKSVSDVAEEQLEIVNKELPEAETKLAEIANTLYDLTEYKEKNDSHINTMKESIADYKTTIAARNGSLAILNAQIEKAKEAIARAKEENEEARVAMFFSKFYGKTGIQPIIIDMHLPKLDELIGELFFRMSDEKLRCYWTTQSANADGEVKEKMTLVISDEKGERDSSTLSGYETMILHYANRIGLAQWISLMTGKPIGTMIIDEACSTSDEESTARIVDALRSINNVVPQAILVTPKQEILNQVGSGFSMSRNPEVVVTKI